MSQLTMHFFRGTPLPPLAFPEGYSASTYHDERDKAAWVACCQNGLLAPDATPDVFDASIGGAADCVPERDCLFLDRGGEHVGTVTAIYHPDRRCGHVHMFSIRPDSRGLGLGRVLVAMALSKLAASDPEFTFLKTDDWRLPAIRSYLRAGFQPVMTEPGMDERWNRILASIQTPTTSNKGKSS